MIYQGRTTEIFIKAVSGGSGVTGLTFESVVVSLRKFSEAGLTEKPLVAEDFIELENGFYVLVLSEIDTNTLGSLFIKVTGAFDIIYHQDYVVPVPISILQSPSLCLLVGNIVDVGGDPEWNSPITFRIVELPKIFYGSLVSSKAIRTVTDAFGNFTVPLLRGATVVVGIENTAIKHTILIPQQETADLTDLLPTLP